MSAPSDKIAVKRHMRRRTGKTAKVAQILGLSPYIEVEPFKRRRPAKLVPKPFEPWTTELWSGFDRAYDRRVVAANLSQDLPRGPYVWKIYRYAARHGGQKIFARGSEKNYDVARRKARVAFLKALGATR